MNKELNISQQVTPAPEFLQHRIDMFDRLKAAADAEIARKYESTL